ncbi:cysteine hydrolase family protein [Variovorax sp. LT1P1]
MSQDAAPDPPARNVDLDDLEKTALLIVDMISCWDFVDALALQPFACQIAPRIAALRRRCASAGVPTVYCNDNRGRWRSDRRALVDSAMESGGAGAEITRLLLPTDDDYFVLKPMQSAFYATPLELLLKHLGKRQIILAGVSSDQCIMATATDAKMREMEVLVPADGVATQSAARNRAALLQFRRTHGIATPRVDDF